MRLASMFTSENCGSVQAVPRLIQIALIQETESIAKSSLSVHDSPYRVGIADQTVRREQGIKPSVSFGCRLIAASTSGRLLATHSLTAADHTAFSAACRGPGTRSSTANPLISLPTVILSGYVSLLSSKVFDYTSTSKVFPPSPVQDLRPVSALPAPGALESARRPLQLLIEAALPAVQLSRVHRVCPASFFQGPPAFHSWNTARFCSPLHRLLPPRPLWTRFIMNSIEPFWLMIPVKYYMGHDEFHESVCGRGFKSHYDV